MELRNGGNVLTAAEALPALSSNRSFASTIVTLQEQFDPAAVTKLKKLHQDFFHTPNPSGDAKDTALEFQNRLRTEAIELEKLASTSRDRSKLPLARLKGSALRP